MAPAVKPTVKRAKTALKAPGLPRARQRPSRPQANEVSSAVLLGRQIRDLRVAKGLSLSEVADAIDKSVGYLSQCERGQSEVSITTLKAIADVLGVQIGWFFQGLDPKASAEQGIVVRREQRRQLTFPGTGIDEALLSPNLNGEAELILSTFAPGAVSGERPVSRAAEQSGYVLTGELSLSVENRVFRLREGDSFRIERQQKYLVKNTGRVSATSLWVIAPPRY
jgi:transcriptional regulator with XRE-family HTH domain